jgi:hypothetical protein
MNVLPPNTAPLRGSTTGRRGKPPTSYPTFHSGYWVPPAPLSFSLTGTCGGHPPKYPIGHTYRKAPGFEGSGPHPNLPPFLYFKMGEGEKETPWTWGVWLFGVWMGFENEGEVHPAKGAGQAGPRGGWGLYGKWTN